MEGTSYGHAVQERVTGVDVIVGYQNSTWDDITIQFDSTIRVGVREGEETRASRAESKLGELRTRCRAWCETRPALVKSPPWRICKSRDGTWRRPSTAKSRGRDGRPGEKSSLEPRNSENPAILK